MNVQQIKKLLRRIKPERIKISNKVRFKIESVYGIKVKDVIENMRNPCMLKHVEEQPSRKPHDETYSLVFELSKRRKLFVVITYKTLENKIYIVTAYQSTKKIEKLIRKPRIRY